MTTSTTAFGTMHTPNGQRRRLRIARMALKSLTEEELKTNLIHLQGYYAFQDSTIQGLRLEIQKLYTAFSDRVSPITPIAEMSTASAHSPHPSYAIVESFRAQLFRVLPMFGNALAKVVVNKIVALVAVVGCNRTRTAV